MSRPSKIAVIKELGARSPRCLAAHAVRGHDEPELVIVERYPGALGAEVLGIVEEDAKELSSLEHPNVATLIASVKLKGDIALLSEWVDGESLESVLAAPNKPSLELLLRVASDVLEGLSVLHASHEGRVCGALGSDDVFVGVDGLTRIARFGLGRVPAGALGKRRFASMSPEFLRGERSVRGDVFTAGTLLWECFTGERLFATPASLEEQQQRLSSSPPRVDTSKRPEWAAPLADVIARALATNPAERYATVSELSAAVAHAVPGKIASRSEVTQHVARTFGEHIEARVTKLEPRLDGVLSLAAPPTTTPPPAVVVQPTPALPKEIKLPEAAKPAAEPAKPAAGAAKPTEAAKPVEAKPVEAAKPAAGAAKPTEAAKPAAGAAKPTEAAKPATAVAKAKPLEPAKVPAAKPVEIAKTPFRKPAQSTPDALSLGARKAGAVPLPKRSPSMPDAGAIPAAARDREIVPKAPTSAPDLAQARGDAGAVAKTNGSGAHPAPPPKTEAVPAKKPGSLPGIKIGAPVYGPPPTSEPEVEPEPAPTSIRDELDVDLDVVSVRPPPGEAAAKTEPEPVPEATSAPALARAPVSSPEVAPAPAVAETSATGDDDAADELPFVRPGRSRGPLLVLGSILLLGGGFAAGRLTAAESLPGWPASAVTAPVAASAPAEPSPPPPAPASAQPSAAPSASAAQPVKVAPTASASAAAAPSASPSATAVESATEDETARTQPRTAPFVLGGPRGNSGVTPRPDASAPTYVPSGI